MKHFGERSSLYVYNNSYSEFKNSFLTTGGNIYEGFYGLNLFRHLHKLVQIIDQNKVNIVQTQFSMGEALGFLTKLIRPKIKFVIAFEGSLSPKGYKRLVSNQVYKKVEAFVFISKYVKSEKTRQFPVLEKKFGKIIFNGTEKRLDDGSKVDKMNKVSILAIAGLIELKNIVVVIRALNILINNKKSKNIFFYVVGDGPKREELQLMIIKYELEDHVFLLGYQKNVGALIDACDIFVHPSYAEGFGIAVAEAMLAKKPIIVANAGALPELIENEKSGLVIDPFDPEIWADAISLLLSKRDYAEFLANNAKLKAEQEFSIQKYTSNYEKLYHTVLTQ